MRPKAHTWPLPKPVTLLLHCLGLGAVALLPEVAHGGVAAGGVPEPGPAAGPFTNGNARPEECPF
jgi:hypothetical protein